MKPTNSPTQGQSSLRTKQVETGLWDNFSHSKIIFRGLGLIFYRKHHQSLTRVTKSYLLALGTTQISSFFTKHRTKLLTRQTGNYPVTCFGSKPSRITLVESSIINTSYQKLPVINKLKISPRRDSNSRTNTSCIRGLPLVHRGDLHRTSKTTLNTN